MCRRFGWLHLYVLLELQDELRELEQKLELHDREVYKKGDRKSLKSRRGDRAQKVSRQDLMIKIQNKLKEYGEKPSRLMACHLMDMPLTT